MIVMKLCAALTMCLGAILAFALLRDLVQFGGARFTDGRIAPLGETVFMLLAFIVICINGFESLTR